MHLARVIDRFLTYNNLSLLLIRKSLEVIKNKQTQKFKITNPRQIRAQTKLAAVVSINDNPLINFYFFYRSKNFPDMHSNSSNIL